MLKTNILKVSGHILFFFSSIINAYLAYIKFKSWDIITVNIILLLVLINIYIIYIRNSSIQSFLGIILVSYLSVIYFLDKQIKFSLKIYLILTVIYLVITALCLIVINGGQK